MFPGYFEGDTQGALGTPHAGGGGSFDFSSLLGPLGTIGGGLISMVGGMGSNRKAKKEASANREFQLYMSNTAHQREVEDLRKAGLNPILSATKGATTPGGAMATYSNPLEHAGAGVASGAKMSALEKPLIEAQIKSATADTAQKVANAHLLNEQAIKTGAERRLIDQQTLTSAADVTLKEKLGAKAEQDIRESGVRMDLDTATTALREAEKMLSIAHAKQYDIMAQKLLKEIDAIKADLNKKEAVGNLYNVGKSLTERVKDAYNKAEKFWNANNKRGASDWMINQFKGAGTMFGEGVGNVFGGGARARQFSPDIGP